MISEVQRRRRIANMMITMHSILKDGYSRRAILLDFVIFLNSIIIAALTFVDPRILETVSWSPEIARIAVGILAILTFFAGVVAWRVNWKARADAHERAAAAYDTIMFRFREIVPETDPYEIERTITRYEEISKNAISIPDSEFLSLKSRYLAKVRLSRILDRAPAAFLPLVILRLKLRHTIRAMKDRSDRNCDY